MELFAVATLNKVRWPLTQQGGGQITAEQLWDLNLKALDSIYKALMRQKKAVSEESLLDEATTEDRLLTLQIDIVKYIVTHKKTEVAAAVTARERKAKKERLMEILADKQNAAMQNLTEEEIKAMLAELE